MSYHIVFIFVAVRNFFCLKVASYNIAHYFFQPCHETPADSQTSFSSISCSIVEVDEDSIVVLPREHDTSTVSMGGSRSSERENAGDDPNSVVTTSVSVVPVKIRKPKSNAKSSIWNYFEVYTAKAFKDLAVCLICDAEVYYSDSMSTIMLQRHLRGKHRSVFDS